MRFKKKKKKKKKDRQGRSVENVDLTLIERGSLRRTELRCLLLE